MGVCFDCAGVWAEGYDIVGDLDGVLEGFDRTIGLNKLKAVHLNDATHERGSHVDRHARIGEGKIGFDALAALVNHPKLAGVPFLSEEPDSTLVIYERDVARFRRPTKGVKPSTSVASRKASAESILGAGLRVWESGAAGRPLARVAGASAGRRTVSRLHRREALGLGGNARSRTAGCGGCAEAAAARAGVDRKERWAAAASWARRAWRASSSAAARAANARSASRRALRDILRSGTTMGCCTAGPPCTQASTSDCAGIGMLLGVQPLPAGAGRGARPRALRPKERPRRPERRFAEARKRQRGARGIGAAAPRGGMGAPAEAAATADAGAGAGAGAAALPRLP